jgi:hypothetical protein
MLLDDFIERRKKCVNYLLHKTIGAETFAILKIDATVFVISENYDSIDFYKKIFVETGRQFESTPYEDLWGMEVQFSNYEEAEAFYNNLTIA